LNPDVYILSYLDDHYLIGSVDDILKAFNDLKDALLPLGLIISENKSQIFSLKEFTRQQIQAITSQSIPYDSSINGITVVGIPIGSDEYISQSFRQKTQTIINEEFPILSKLIDSPNGTHRYDIQVAYTIVRLCLPSQLVFLSRTCLPTIIHHEATSFDNELREFVYNMIGSTDLFHHVKNVGDGATIQKRFHLSIHHGGLGIMSTSENLDSAFIGSMSLCLHPIISLFPRLLQNVTPSTQPTLIPTINAYYQSCANVNEFAMEKAEDIVIEKMVDSQKFGIQHMLTQLRHEFTDKGIKAQLPSIKSCAGYSVTKMNDNDVARVAQYLSNKDQLNSAFLLANPLNHLSKISNSAFVIALQIRLGFPLLDESLLCPCDQQAIGFNYQHLNRCSTLRKSIRNPMHQSAKKYLCPILHHWNSASSLGYTIHNNEPKMEMYFDRALSTTSTKKQVVSRADILLEHSTRQSILIDVTSTESAILGTKAIGYSHAGCAAKLAMKKKLDSYRKLWDINSKLARLLIVPFEINGVMDAQSWELLRDVLIPPLSDNKETMIRYLRQHLSIALHAIRAESIENARSILSISCLAPSNPLSQSTQFDTASFTLTPS
jgi:hypothetical protein